MKNLIGILVFGGMYFYVGYDYGVKKGREAMTKEANRKICQAMNEKGDICSHH